MCRSPVPLFPLLHLIVLSLGQIIVHLIIPSASWNINEVDLQVAWIACLLFKWTWILFPSKALFKIWVEQIWYRPDAKTHKARPIYTAQYSATSSSIWRFVSGIYMAENVPTSESTNTWSIYSLSLPLKNARTLLNII